jgi:hypothetical protein
MKTFKLGLLTGACAIAACTAIAAAPQAAEAQAWNYGMDSSYDGTGPLFGGGFGVGPTSHYEAFGMAYTADNDTVTFAFNANFGINGRSYAGAADGNIGWGDLFLNLDPDKNFTDSKAAGSVLGIRFAGTNDSGMSETGVFSNITTKNVTGQNSGWSSYNSYNNYVGSKTNGSVELIDGKSREDSEAYLGAHGQSVLNSGTKVGDVSVLDNAALTNMGLNFGSGGSGSETFGFSFARSLLPGGDLNWVAHVMAECANDTVGMSGEFAAQTPPPGGPGGEPPVGTPEPSVMLGSAAALYGVWKGKRRAKKNKA